MANNVLRRIGEHEAKQRNKRKILNSVIMPICCLCLVALLGIGLWQSDLFKTTAPIDSGESPTVTEEDCLEIDYSSEYTVSNTVLDSAKAEKMKFEVNMTVNISTVDECGVATMNKTTKIPLNSNNITLEIINNNDEIFIFCSGFWRLEKIENGEYKEVVTSNYAASSSCGPNNSCFVLCDLNKYSNQISEGKYRIISPTLNIAKETENGLQDYIYQNEKSFILYSEFEFVK